MENQTIRINKKLGIEIKVFSSMKNQNKEDFANELLEQGLKKYREKYPDIAL